MMIERPILFSGDMVRSILKGWKTQTRRVLKNQSDANCIVSGHDWEIAELLARCPYGKPGTTIWVRETAYYHEQEKLWYYRATDPLTDSIDLGYRWKPSIFMPREACRILLKNTGVRVERLQDISEEDAKAEGVERWIEDRMVSKPVHYKVYCDLDSPNDPATYSSAAYDSFQSLWYKINGKESWDSNPWVWVVNFEVQNIEKLHQNPELLKT